VPSPSTTVGDTITAVRETCCSLPLGRRDDGLDLVRVRAFRPARVDSCDDVIIRLSGLNGSVDEGCARVGGYYGAVGPTRNTRPVHVVALHVRARTRTPGKVNAVLSRRHSTSTQ